jgi:riboflavin synthase
MFTGLVQKLGVVRGVRPHNQGRTFEIEASYDAYALGESIAVDGACLTVAEVRGPAFTAHASAETLAKTCLGARRAGERVHLERALRLGDAVGGHLVTGHVDGIGRVVAQRSLGDALEVVYEAPEALAPLIAPKGSVTVSGVSLTVNGVAGRRFDVVLVPYTRQHTLLDTYPIGCAVNLEVDVLAKYVARLLGKPGVDGKTSAPSLDQLAREGYL